MAPRKTLVAAPPPPPKRRNCGAMQVHQHLLETVVGFRAKMQLLEHATTRRLSLVAPVWKPIVIPVVVNVVYRTAAENILDAQIASQIKVLNLDYRGLNPDKSKVPAPFAGLFADVGVTFKLVKTVRKATTKASFAANDSVKSAAGGGVAPTDPKRNLNLWVCTLGDGLLGYAQFPGGPVATDGVVVLNTGFGTVGTARAPFNLGRTTTHEVGHWLNLRHIWGDTEDCTGGDAVVDTPNAMGPNFGTPKFPHVTCSNGPNGDMFMDYMDYVDDKAMFMFTKGQSERMHTALLGPRKTYRV